MVNKPSEAAGQPVPRRLRLLRQAEGYETAKDFAEVLGVTANRYGNIEAGSGLSIDIAQRIVKAVPGCSLDWLYNGVENGLSVSLRQRLAELSGGRHNALDGAAKGRTLPSRSPRSPARSRA